MKICSSCRSLLLCFFQLADDQNFQLYNKGCSCDFDEEEASECEAGVDMETNTVLNLNPRKMSTAMLQLQRSAAEIITKAEKQKITKDLFFIYRLVFFVKAHSFVVRSYS